MTAKNRRIWELDLLRGFALILMIYFHIVYDLKEIFHYAVSYETGLNYYIGKAAGVLFIFIAGVSSTLSRSNALRALKILSLAVAITLVTHLYNPDMGVKFGILHFLGVSMLTAPLAQKGHPYLLLVLGIVTLAVSPYVLALPVSHNHYFPLGLTTPSFISADYYPLLPWYGVFLFGLAAGRAFYRKKTSLFKFSLPENIISKAGSRTLVIYLLHQPVILLVLAIYTRLF